MGWSVLFCQLRLQSGKAGGGNGGESAEATVDNPESIKILGVSKADSVFGKEYVSPHEKVSLSMHLMQYGQKLMEETDFFENLDKDDIGISEQMKRQLDAMTTLRALIAPEI